ncbi:MAG TPA: F0F1 ATP synthase subunit alpha, partial [Methanosarcina sp.]|nr:F0F1 ATP synthase subunit alpha [Methanosarcina sp.]
DNVPLDKMREAESSLRKAVTDIPADVRDQFKGDKKLSDKDREAILNVARKALEPYQPKPESESKPKAKTEEKTETQTEEKTESKAQNKGKSEPEAKTEEKVAKLETQTKGKSEPEAKEKS